MISKASHLFSAGGPKQGMLHQKHILGAALGCLAILLLYWCEVMYGPSKIDRISLLSVQSFAFKDRISSPYAWVYMSNSENTLLHVLVSSKSARLQGSAADIVVLWFGEALPSKCMQDALKGVGAKLHAVEQPIDRDKVENPQFVDVIDKQNKWWDWVKLLTFDLTEYKKVVFLDG